MEEKKELLKKLKKVFQAELKQWDDEEMEFKFKGSVEAIKYAIAILYPKTPKDRDLKESILNYKV